ncbi:MAG: tRNA methyltransferase [Desulfuromonadaceae bacterium GWC2_58_13]|nr:MAG: tRNA methyltransferase [Desulfuromonadaceae bacterium GWC2_58_13]
MEDKQVEQLEFDIRGQVCPSTLLTTLKEINRHSKALKAGELHLTVKTDARDATATIPQMVKNMGYAVSVVKQDGYYCIMVGKDV